MSDKPSIVMEIKASREIQQAPVDTTLAIQGAAADAQAVGQAITRISDYIGSGTLPGGSSSVLEALNAISTLIGSETLPEGATTIGGALAALNTKYGGLVGEGITGKTLTEAVTEISALIGDAALPLDATTVTEALNAILAAAVRTINGVAPDANGNVDVDTGVLTVNGQEPDENGDVVVEAGLSDLTVNGVAPDEQGAIVVPTGVMTVNGEQPDENGNVNLDDLEGIVKTVNGEEPDSSGNVNVTRVSFADDLYTEDSQESKGNFICRLAGGDASIADSTVSIKKLLGKSVRTGYTPENYNYSVTWGTRTEEQEPIIVSVDWATFIAQVGGEDTNLDISFDGEDWDYTLADYGVTVTSGTPVDGDVIHLSYETEVRGHITNSFPLDFTTTGWNLYDNTTGYARVIHYSDTYGYRIDGTYTTIRFCTEQGGTETPISPDANGLFNITQDGYVHIVGGNNTDTAIYPTWSDWQEGTPNEFEPYVEYSMPLSSAITAIFAAGMCSVGTVKDELSPSSQTYVRRINRIAYSAANLESVIAQGTDYIYDNDYIYYVLQEPISGTYTMDTGIPVNSHGLEIFNSSTAVECVLLYGQALKDKLRRGVLTIGQQTLTEAQKTQVQGNIGLPERLATIDVTNKVVFGAPSTGEVVESYAFRNCNMVHIAFPFRFTSAVNAGSYVTLPLTFIDESLAPVARTEGGGANNENIQLIDILPSPNRITFYVAKNRTAGQTAWITITYMCRG